MLDANNLYGGVMQNDHLPLKDFALDAHITLEEVLKISSTAQHGYIIEVDIDYPPEFHEAHQDYPLAPSKLKIKHSWLSGYQKNLKVQMHLPQKSSGPKLVQTLLPKSRYTLHYWLAQFYNSVRLKITKLHRASKFEQANWMRPYMELNTSLRIAASTAFGKKFYKGMNNSAFGKTCESERNRDQVVIVRNAQSVLQRTQNFQFKSFKIFGESMAAMRTAKKRIYWNKPTIVGACVLDLAKLHMFKFHYTVMKPNFDRKVLYPDTASLLYRFNTIDVYEDIRQKIHILQHFDFSNYPPQHPLFSKVNEYVVLKFKDEFARVPTQEFCALKPKLYSVIAIGKLIFITLTRINIQLVSWDCS